MKIAIEAQRIFRANKHGMDFVVLESIRQLQKIDKENEYYIFVSPGPDRCLEESGNVHIIELEMSHLPGNNWRYLLLCTSYNRTCYTAPATQLLYAVPCHLH